VGHQRGDGRQAAAGSGDRSATSSDAACQAVAESGGRSATSVLLEHPATLAAAFLPHSLVDAALLAAAFLPHSLVDAALLAAAFLQGQPVDLATPALPAAAE
jgi:hypothetical protein